MMMVYSGTELKNTLRTEMNLFESCKTVLFGEGSSPEYGCLMAMIPEKDLQEFQKLFRRIVPSQDDLHENGFEDEPHVTAFYGFNLDFDTDRLLDLIKLPIEFTITDISTFDCPDYDVLKFDVDSKPLVELNQSIADNLPDGTLEQMREYHPHLTIAYLKKGAGLYDSEAGQGLIGKTFTISELLYSLPEKAGRIVFTLDK